MKLMLSSIFYSFILLSNFTFQLFSFNGNYYFEVALLSCAIYFILVRDSVGISIYTSIQKYRNTIILACILLTPFLVIGIVNWGSPAASYADYRSNLVFIISFIIAKRVIGKFPYEILLLGFMTSLLTMINWLYLYKIGGLDAKFPFPLFSIVLTIILATKLRKLWFLLGAILILAFTAAVSFFRQYWIISALTVLYIFIDVPKFTKRLRSWKIIFSVSTLLVLIAYYSYPILINFFYSDQSRYIQSIGKSVDLLNMMGGLQTDRSDSLRLAYFVYAYDQFPSLILPHGLGSKAMGDTISPWFNTYSPLSSTIDSSFIFVVYHYGYIVVLPLLLWYIKKLYSAYMVNGIMVQTTWLLIFAVPLFLDGGQLTVTDRAFWYGLFSSYIVNNFGDLPPKNCLPSVT